MKSLNFHAKFRLFGFRGIYIFKPPQKLPVKRERIVAGVFTIYLGDDHICRNTVKKNAEIGLKEAVAATEAVVEIFNGEIAPILVDIRQIRSISREAREHFTMKNRKPNVSAIGLLVKSPLSSLIGNFFLGINKSSVPTRIFTSEKKATEWLRKFL